MRLLRSSWLGFILLTAGSFALLWSRSDWLAFFGIRLPLGYWYVDTYALLASSDAFALGLNPYESNPLDYLHVPHWYSDWWFWMHDFGLTRADAHWLGLAVVLVFLLAACLVLRPGNRGETLYCWLAVCSPPVLLGANRANIDLFIFAAIALAGWLMTRKVRAFRLLAPPIIAIMAGLKFYPLAAGAALPFASQSRRESWLMLAYMTLLAVLLALGLYDDVQRVSGLINTPLRLYTFGAMQGLPNGEHDLGFKLTVIFLGFLLLLFWWKRAPEAPPGLDATATAWFALGTAIVAGCYFVGVSYNYRLVFALLLLPLLGVLWRQSSPGLLRKLIAVVGAGLLVLLWLDGLVCLCLKLNPGWMQVASVIEFRQALYAVASWVWMGALLGLGTALARPVVRGLLQAGALDR